MSEYPWGQVSVDSQDNGLISICWDVSRSCNALAKRWTASYSNDVSVCESYTWWNVMTTKRCGVYKIFHAKWLDRRFQGMLGAREKTCQEKSIFLEERKSYLNIVWYNPSFFLHNMFFSLLVLLIYVAMSLYLSYLQHVSVSDIKKKL